MKTYRLETTQHLPTSIETAWEFFSDPRNLAIITPPWLGFKVVSTLPSRMYAGMIITYTVTPLLGVPLTWVTEITRTEEPYFFVDEQRVGPYRLWHHEHHFREIPGGVEARDLVHYALPCGLIGRIVHCLVVRRQLSRIFAFRRRALIKQFGAFPAEK